MRRDRWGRAIHMHISDKVEITFYLLSIVDGIERNGEGKKDAPLHVVWIQ